jgi:hypothetical protein
VRKTPIDAVRACLFLLTLSGLACGCAGSGGVSRKTVVPVTARPVAKEASQEELWERYNSLARNLHSVDATVELKTTTGSQYNGVINEYHEVKAFILAAKPDAIRMIGQVPVVGKTIFDMASDGTTFALSMPTKNKFLEGPVAFERASSKPIENLRPQHLVDALLWPEIRKEELVFVEESNDEIGRYYVLNVLRGGYRVEIFRKVWFDRADLSVVRVENYGPKGALLSDAHYSEWQSVGGDAATGSQEYPRKIRIERPRDEYRLDVSVSKIALNEMLEAARFKLEPPAGAEIVHLGETNEASKP